MKIAVLGWGSLLWDTESTKGKEFERHLERCSGSDGLWCEGGPTLRAGAKITSVFVTWVRWCSSIWALSCRV